MAFESSGVLPKTGSSHVYATDQPKLRIVGSAFDPFQLLLKSMFVLLFWTCASQLLYGAGGPTITSLGPNSDAIGATVSIYGSGFGSSQGSSTVTFNGTRATTISSWSSSSIGVVVPAGTTTGNVVVTVSGKSSNGVLFTVVPAPIISSVVPTTGSPFERAIHAGSPRLLRQLSGGQPQLRDCGSAGDGSARMSQETVAAQDMLTRFTQWQRREPAPIAADATNGNGEFLQWLLDRGITPYMRTRDSTLRRNNPGYGPERFTYLPESNSFRCPAGEQLNYVGLNVRNRAHAYIGSAKRCGACSQKGRCFSLPVRVEGVEADLNPFAKTDVVDRDAVLQGKARHIGSQRKTPLRLQIP